MKKTFSLALLVVFSFSSYALEKNEVNLSSILDSPTPFLTKLYQALNYDNTLDELITLMNKEINKETSISYSKLESYIFLIGFAADNNNEKAIEILNEFAFTNDKNVKIFRVPAINSLFRIGGDNAKKILNNLYLEKEPKVIYHVLHMAWKLKKTEELVFAKKTITDIAPLIPDKITQEYIKNIILPIMDKAIYIHKNPNNKKSQEIIKNIILKKEWPFDTEVGSEAIIWALHKIKQFTDDVTKDMLINSINDSSSHPRHIKLLSRIMLGEGGDIGFLQPNHLIVTLDKQDVKKLYKSLIKEN